MFQHLPKDVQTEFLVQFRRHIWPALQNGIREALLAIVPISHENMASFTPWLQEQFQNKCFQGTRTQFGIVYQMLHNDFGPLLLEMNKHWITVQSQQWLKQAHTLLTKDDFTTIPIVDIAQHGLTKSLQSQGAALPDNIRKETDSTVTEYENLMKKMQEASIDDSTNPQVFEFPMEFYHSFFVFPSCRISTKADKFIKMVYQIVQEIHQIPLLR